MKSQNHAKFISFYKNDLFKIFQNNDSHFKVFFALIIFLYTYLHVTNGVFVSCNSHIHCRVNNHKIGCNIPEQYLLCVNLFCLWLDY
ncbi:hypothetical protein MtrunA17_Chr1g0167541 [Medicago truncatula]|uniref:Nodule-specific cysteine-rich peptide 56 n=1 Tax=Medicago truncatula TaxID=3880 RepID=A7KH74_MEDTR|nr:nodule-specific cysteine-rich peptide 56 [Medicago truncatula]AES60269.1 transmembrane protein, putative [Medicago truncatula]RHN78586.1 hypothetical protein MtrunA17_Chr1g0167541 [Medicago truncatula]